MIEKKIIILLLFARVGWKLFKWIRKILWNADKVAHNHLFCFPFLYKYIFMVKTVVFGRRFFVGANGMDSLRATEQHKIFFLSLSLSFSFLCISQNRSGSMVCAVVSNASGVRSQNCHKPIRRLRIRIFLASSHSPGSEFSSKLVFSIIFIIMIIRLVCVYTNWYKCMWWCLLMVVSRPLWHNRYNFIANLLQFFSFIRFSY